MARAASRRRNEIRLWLYGRNAEAVPDTLSALGLGYRLVSKTTWPIIIDIDPMHEPMVDRLMLDLSTDAEPIRLFREEPASPPLHEGVRPDLYFDDADGDGTTWPEKARDLQERTACAAYPEFKAWTTGQFKSCPVRTPKGHRCTLPAKHKGDHVVGAGETCAARWANDEDPP